VNAAENTHHAGDGSPAGSPSSRALRRLLFWTCLPVLTPQALWVRRTAPRFADAEGPTSGSAGRGPGKRLVAIGDSIIAGVGAPTLRHALVGQTATQLADRLGATVHWQAFGRTGQRSRDLVTRQLPSLPETVADFVIVSMGVNDVTGLSTTKTYATHMRDALDGIRQRYPDARIAVAGLPPLGIFPLLPQPLRAFLGMRAAMLDDTLRGLVERMPGAAFVPVEFEFSPERFSADGFHPSPLGYREYGASMADALLGIDEGLIDEG
jgi:lysophospholipase L1-like esterase